jgi:hypothetical protein
MLSAPFYQDVERRDQESTGPAEESAMIVPLES